MPIESENRRRAIKWLVSLQQQQEPSEVDVQEWEQWIADPDHQVSFDAAMDLWNRTGAIGPLSLPDTEQLAGDDYDGSESIAEWRARRASAAPEELRYQSGNPTKDEGLRPLSAELSLRHTKRRYPPARFATAAAAAIAVIGWIFHPQIWSMFINEPQLYETSIAEHREVELADGSRVLLGAQTSLWTTYTLWRRTVVLDRGEALFDVASDPRRPFSVHAGHGTITAVGTSFAVQRSQQRVKVTVAEGVVRVEPRVSSAAGAPPGSSAHNARPVIAILTKNQQVSYDERGSGNVSIIRVNADFETAWREGQLQYVDEPLRNVIADVNRYSQRQVILTDSQAYDLRFTGVLFQDNIDQWIDQLTEIFPLLEIVETDAEHVVLRSQVTARTIDDDLVTVREP